jgi:hypothetical protein
MFRLKIAAIIGGLVLAYFGVQEYRVSMGTSAEPMAVDLAALEGGETPDNNHILIGQHVADYDGCVYEYEEGSGRVTHMYYPIISDSNSFFDELNALYEKYDNPDDIPEQEHPGIHEFRVLVKTKRYKTENSIPAGLGAEDSVQGLVINLIDSMDKEEERMIQSEFPKVNMDELLIVEDGRKPTSMFASLGMVGGGGLLSFLGLAWMFLGGGGSSQARRA